MLYSILLDMDQYFQEKKFTFIVDPAAYSSLQGMRALYLLSGKGINSIPTITELVSGMLLYVSHNLAEDRKMLNKGTQRKPLVLKEATKVYSNLMIERELSKEEYESLAALTEPDLKISDNEQELPYAEGPFIRMEPRGQRIELNRPEQINIIIREDDLSAIKGLEFQINELRGTRYIYSVSDVIRNTISLVSLSVIKRTYFLDSYIAHLYDIDIPDFLRFNFHYSDNSSSNNIRKLKAAMIDERIVLEMYKLAEELSPYFRKGKTDKALKIIKEGISDYNRFWSYVSNFNYIHAYNGLNYAELMLLMNGDFTDTINTFRLGDAEFQKIFEGNKKPLDNFEGQGLLLFQLFANGLYLFMERLKVARDH